MLILIFFKYCFEIWFTLITEFLKCSFLPNFVPTVAAALSSAQPWLVYAWHVISQALNKCQLCSSSSNPVYTTLSPVFCFTPHTASLVHQENHILPSSQVTSHHHKLYLFFFPIMACGKKCSLLLNISETYVLITTHITCQGRGEKLAKPRQLWLDNLKGPLFLDSKLIDVIMGMSPSHPSTFIEF